ncbi:hypothetical protein ACIBG8_34410 [Nonomuraea sp. NPDC050556]|uniref:hypothetical protein n=1 Tax=Nonomuraea sp. NPDC050556 TaxID=3364369 RepID=UPI003797BB0C
MNPSGSRRDRPTPPCELPSPFKAPAKPEAWCDLPSPFKSPAKPDEWCDVPSSPVASVVGFLLRASRRR